MAANAADVIPGIIFCLLSFIFLVLVCVSTPITNTISFLYTVVGGTFIQFGVFGFTGSARQIGYFFPIPGLRSNVIHNLTYVLVLYPVAASLSGLAFVLGIFGVIFRPIRRAVLVTMTVLVSLATLCTLIAWIVSMTLFGIARNHLLNAGIIAFYGNANWLALTALITLFIGVATAACGIFGFPEKKSRASGNPDVVQH